jgi:tetratricopeptide (TPR) repeat protein
VFERFALATGRKQNRRVHCRVKAGFTHGRRLSFAAIVCNAILDTPGSIAFGPAIAAPLAQARLCAVPCCHIQMSLQEQYDDAMFAFSKGYFDGAIAKLKVVLAADPAHFDAQLSLGMAYYRKGDYAAAIVEGHKAEKLRPNEQLVHTNLSLFYMKAGDKTTAEHHGSQARIASWKADKSPPGAQPAGEPELQMARPNQPAVKLPPKFPDMPWKKKVEN